MSASPRRAEAPIEQVTVQACKIPTDRPEADGTISWDSTTLVVVEVSAGGRQGLGYTYASTAAAKLIQDTLTGVVRGKDALAIPAAWRAMVHSVRNIGRPGVASMAISAVDAALWDLKGKLLGVPLVTLLGAARSSVPVYGSGGFTSYTPRELSEQLAGWAAQGIPRVKMKVGSHPEDDPDRVRIARAAIGSDVELFVDSNGAYSSKQALALAERFAEFGACWFEEPVSSDDLEGLRLIRDRAPAGMDIAAGEYGFSSIYFRRMLQAGAVDVLQADATRCGGITGFMEADALCAGFEIDLSAHCAPSLHAHPGCAAIRMRHIEYFHDHVRIEHLLFDGALRPIKGELVPDLSRPGFGLEFKHADASRYSVSVD